MNIYKYACTTLAIIALAACSETDNWEPGPKAEVKTQVYVISASQSGEVMPGETCQFTVTLGRDNADGAISVPLKATTTGNYTVPESATFAAGENRTEVSVSFTATNDLGYFTANISIPEGEFNSPYTDKPTTAGISTLVAKWNKLYDAKPRFTSNKGVAAYTPELFVMDDPNVAKGSELYRLYNAFPGMNLTFKLKEILWDSTGKPYYARISFQNGQALSTDPFEWGYSAWAMFDQDEDYLNDLDNHAWVTLPGSGTILFNPFVIDDTSYDYPVIDFTAPQIYMMLCYTAYDTDWNEDEDNYYDYVYFDLTPAK